MIWEGSVRSDHAAEDLATLIHAWHEEYNKVFVLRGSGIGNVRDFYQAQFPKIGAPVALGEDVGKGDRDNQRTGDVWMEVRYDPSHPDAYRHSASAQPLHTDGSYIPDFPNATLMACVANAGEGGETIFIDAEDVVTSLEHEAPDLLVALRARSITHTRSGDRRTEKIVDSANSTTLVNWNYFCIDKDIDSEGRALVERFFNFLANSPMIRQYIQAVKLMPGDAVTWKDRQVLHGRNAFIANRDSERFLWKCAIDVANFDD